MAVLVMGILTVGISTHALYSGDVPIYLGVLEPPVDESGANRFRVRVAFKFVDGHWSSMPHEARDMASLASVQGQYPAKVSWTVAFDGKKVGVIESLRSSGGSLSYANIGVQELAPGAVPPAIRDGATAYKTWLGVPRSRPLVVISGPNFADPDRWKPFRPPADLRSQARVAFRRAIGLELECGAKASTAYPIEYVQALDKAYRSAKGDVLLAARADPNKNRCSFNYDEWEAVWFWVKEGHIRLVGGGLTLLDAGDYDGDGVSEIVFQRRGYNLDGYVLLHLPDFTKEEFVWSYH